MTDEDQPMDHPQDQPDTGPADDPGAEAGAPPTDPDAASAAPPPESEVEQSKDARTMGMLCHLLAIFTGFIGPLVIWLIKREESAFVDDQGKEALNFQLTALIAFLVLGVLMLVPFVGCVAFLGLMALSVVVIVFCIMATMAANNGQRYRYPVNIRMIS